MLPRIDKILNSEQSQPVLQTLFQQVTLEKIKALKIDWGENVSLEDLGYIAVI